MKVKKNYDFYLGILFLLFQRCLAQRGGYNYARPGIPRVAPSASTPLASPLRPIVAALPSGNTAASGTGTGFAGASTAFGAPSSANVVPSTTGFGSFQGNIGAGFSPTAASATAIGSNFGVGTTSGLPNRAAVNQRSGTGLFGSNVSRGQTTQFTSGTAPGPGRDGSGDIDYEGDGDFSAIPGLPGVNYPIYSQVPQTNFDCAQQALPGYYSDVEAQCQVFHICALNRTYSFLCPNGTVFSQETLVCVWWNQYDCASSPSLYANNAFIYDYGNEGIPASSVSYQDSGAPIGIGIGSTRTQNSFQISSNTGRSPGSTQSTGIFSGSVGIRPTLSSGGGFGDVSTPLPATTTFTGGSIAGQPSVGRRQQQTGVLPTNVVGQTYSGISSGITPATIGNNIARGGVSDTTGILNPNINAQQTRQLQTAQLSMSSTDREYLPPTQKV